MLKHLVPTAARRWTRALRSQTRWWSGRGPQKKGIIEDLYYWVADGRLDTLLPLQNYFSVFFPDIETSTTGTLLLYDADGQPLGRRAFELLAHGLVKLRISQVLQELGVRAPQGYGTLVCDLRMPEAVRASLDPQEPFYFWDRFYIGYLSTSGQPCFVHGVDKTFVAKIAGGRWDTFYPAGKRYRWIPETPVDLSSYHRFSVVLINRTSRCARVTLTISDDDDIASRLTQAIAPFGAHRFELDERSTRGLDRQRLRLRVDGMPTRWGRPVVFKEFANGAISAMHC